MSRNQELEGDEGKFWIVERLREMWKERNYGKRERMKKWRKMEKNCDGYLKYLGWTDKENL